MQRDERALETALLYGDGVLSGLYGASGKQAKQIVAASPTNPSSGSTTNSGAANSFETVEGWAPQVETSLSVAALLCLLQL